ncbi:hypothetical protein ASF65_03815 [Aureimonas sp. Leaf324]|nr:hypothetical protein ASF65_03815 [Aureimonas sp. Leaf324]
MTPASASPRREGRIFNSPLEHGLRMLFILNANEGRSADLQRLVSFDYLLVHSGDADGPESLHPAVPFRGGELLVKREALSMGLDRMFSRELIDKRFDHSGITYASNALTAAFLALLASDYARQLAIRARWTIATFGELDDRALDDFMSERIGKWGAEFNRVGSLEKLVL